MALTVLNNISSLTAENALSNTQMNLQKTLTQLSTGLKINSGSDDAAGLSIVNGMTANIAALTQSQQNASNGIGMLQTADGALSQVGTLLNRAVTLATEASSSNITSSQATALNNEFQSILTEVNQIGNSTNFNGVNVFASNAPTTFNSTQGSVGTPLSAATTLTAGSVTSISDSNTGGTFVYTAAAGDTIATLTTNIAAAVTSGTLSANTAVSFNAAGEMSITNGSTGINVTSNDASLGAMTAAAGTNNTNTVFISDGSTAATAANTQITTTVSSLSAASLGLNTAASDVLTSNATATAALTAITAAITSISAQRGAIGASVNRLTAATSVMSNQVTNLQSAANSLQNADIGKTVANMTQYNVLQSTGMAALQQSNQAQQAVLKLVQ
jgi:flagellin